MSLGAVIYLGGMLLVFAGQRLFAGDDSVQWIVTLLGVGALGVAIGLRLRTLRATGEACLRLGHRVALTFLLAGCGSLLIYLLTTGAVVEALGLEDEAERRWTGAFAALWPIVWLAGTLPMLVVDVAVQSSPVLIQPKRIRQALGHGVVAALGIALVFPVNYIAADHNERWDLAYAKTAAAGSATANIVASLEEPITVRVFQPPSSEVIDDLRGYFDALEGPNLLVEYLDQAAEPALARALKVRDNGVVAFTRGELELEEPEEDDADKGAEGEEPKPKAVTKTLKIGTELDKAKRKLKKLDEEVQKILIDMGQGERIAYLTTGHGEISTKSGETVDRKARGLKKLMEMMGFEVKTIGLGDGLAEEIPSDADLVVVLGPQQPFLPAEVDALEAHQDRGGAVLLALEPDAMTEGGEAATAEDDPLDALAARIGLRMGSGVLASERGIVPMKRNKEDRMNVVTDRFSSHESTQVLSKASGILFLLTPGAGYLEEVEEHGNKVTITVRSLASSWADQNGNLELDADAGESKEMRPLAAVSIGGNEQPWRAMVVADATAFTDLAMGNRGNQQFAYDALNWLIGAEALSGTLESEEDVKIQHTKEGQAAWFYLTVLGAPLLILGGGVLRLRTRRRGRA